MSKDLNKWIGIGRLTRDSDLLYTKNNFPITKFSIANNNMRKGANGYEDEVSYFNCTILGKMGENLNQYLNRGQQVAVEGRLKQERWNDSEGNKRSQIAIMVDSIQLLGKSQGSAADRVEEMFKVEEANFEEDVAF